jgi:type II secretory pathway component GspD/PulD (secretin)
LALTASIALGQKRPEDIKIVFSDTDIAQVLRAISIRTGASIVYSAKDKHPVTLNVTVNNVEDAVRSAASAAGLIYRKVKDVFVVSSPDAMRQALSPYSESISIDLDSGLAAKIGPSIQELLPHTTVRTIGNRLQISGLPYDLTEARSLVDELRTYELGQRPVTAAVQLTQGAAEEVAKTVSAVYPNLIVTSSESGAIVLNGPAAMVDAARELIAKIDMPAAGEGDRRTIYRLKELRYADTGSVREFISKAVPGVEALVAPEGYQPPRARFTPLGQMITAAQGGGSSAQGGFGGGLGGGLGQQETTGADARPVNGPQQTGDPRKSKVVVLRGPSALVTEALRLIDEIDTKPVQVRIEVSVVETTKTFNENLGLKYGFTPFQFFEVPVGTRISEQGIALQEYNTAPIAPGRFSKTPSSFSASLNALIENGQAKVLASPNVQVIDNADANVFIGNTIRARVAQAGALGSQTIEIKEFPIGILLLIHPRVNGTDNITMHVNPVVSTVTAIGTDNIPQTSSREAETTVIVKDGETIVIGGLIRDEYSKTISEVPFLSKLPIIGELFKNRNTQKQRTEVIVTITPRIVRDPEVSK